MVFRQSKRAFTLLELTTVIVIIFILAALLMPSFARIREKARAVKCAANLKSLFVAANGYILDNHQWPQVLGMDPASEAFANSWLDKLKPYQIDQVNWFCPTIQAQIGSENRPFRLDYIPTPFGAKAIAPFLWPTHPWFSERGSVHGNGNLIILTNGSVKALNDITGSSQPAPE